MVKALMTCPEGHAALKPKPGVRSLRPDVSSLDTLQKDLVSLQQVPQVQEDLCCDLHFNCN